MSILFYQIYCIYKQLNILYTQNCHKRVHFKMKYCGQSTFIIIYIFHGNNFKNIIVEKKYKLLMLVAVGVMLHKNKFHCTKYVIEYLQCMKNCNNITSTYSMNNMYLCSADDLKNRIFAKEMQCISHNILRLIIYCYFATVQKLLFRI